MENEKEKTLLAKKLSAVRPIRSIDGSGDSMLFKMLNRMPGTTRMTDDTAEEQVSKLNQQLSRYAEIREGLSQRWFKILEQSMVDRVMEISMFELPEALETGTEQDVLRLMTERKGYVMLFELYDGVTASMTETQKTITEISAGVGFDQTMVENPIPDTKL